MLLSRNLYFSFIYMNVSIWLLVTLITLCIITVKLIFVLGNSLQEYDGDLIADLLDVSS